MLQWLENKIASKHPIFKKLKRTSCGFWKSKAKKLILVWSHKDQSAEPIFWTPQSCSPISLEDNKVRNSAGTYYSIVNRRHTLFIFQGTCYKEKENPPEAQQSY